MTTITRNMLDDDTVTFPESLMLVPQPEQPYRTGSQDDGHDRGHNAAVIAFHKASVGATSDLKRSERGILSLMAGIEQLVGSWAEQADPLTARAVWTLVDGFGDLLNHDLGRLDGGTLSAWAIRVLARFGVDEVSGDYVGHP